MYVYNICGCFLPTTGDALCGRHEWRDETRAHNAMALLVDRIELSFCGENGTQIVVGICGICRDELLCPGECHTCGGQNARHIAMVEFDEEIGRAHV